MGPSATLMHLSNAPLVDDVPPAPMSRAFTAAPDAGAASRLVREVNAKAGRHGPVTVSRPLVLYGAGNLGQLARSHLDIVGIPITLVVDANAAFHQASGAWAGIPVVAPADVPADVKSTSLLAISIVNSPVVPLQRDLTAQGWAHCVPFYDIAEAYRSLHPLSNGWFGAPLSASDLTRIDDVFDGWADDASRAHHLRFAARRLGREEWDFADAEVVPQNRFFIDEITGCLGREERVLDIGAHHGTVLARFLAETGSFAQAWAIEPDAANRAPLARWATSLDAPLRAALTILDAVVAAEPGPAPFHNGLGYASQIARTGAATRPCTTIDALDLRPTLIKLHVEGAELAALRGGRETLRRHRPIVMATTYHNADGLFETPLWLMRHLDDYRILMRTHSWCGTGAVIYAIPNERAGL